MLEFPTWKRIWLWLLAAVAALSALPSIVTVAGGTWPEALPNHQINLGLDLAGGSNLLLEANPDQVAAQRLENLEEDARNVMRNAEPRIRIGNVSRRDGQFTFMVDDQSQVDAAREALLPLVNGSGTTREWNLEVVDGARFVLTPTEAGLEQAVDRAMDTATEVVRRRIDALGTREPTIIREGDTRIVVQVPGFNDPQALKDLLGQTAKLEFKMVDETALPSDIQQGIAPPGAEIVPYAPGTPQQGSSLALRRLGGIKGDALTGAQQSFDSRTNEPVVSFTFNRPGGAKFATLTSQNVGKRFAIVLDEQIISAPVIESPIMGGSGQIQGSFTVESANQLAIQLRSGALPVDLTVIAQGTVGPELGADSIRKGMIAMMVGAVAVLVLMVVTYGRFGVYANLALALNVLMLLGILAIFGSTLTLPGIAGFVLTIGAAVDANVLINERIREERKRGRRVIAAVENGYREASRAIFDANLTNVIAAVLLFLFGSGPVRGFAVVLMIGIVTSVFTAVTITRMWVAGWLRKARPNDIQI